MRKLVTIQTISSVSPIVGADAIEAATVLGWTVVVGKGEFSTGDQAAYFEIDSFLRGDNPAFASFLSRGERTVNIDGAPVVGHVLRTAKLRGVVSQGLLMPLEKLGYTPGHIDVLHVGDDITDALGVIKWEPPLPVGNGEIVGPFDSRFAPKTDAIRLQSLIGSWELIKSLEWEPTVKVDGTSQTLISDAGRLRVFGRNWELSTETAAGFKIAERSGITDAVVPGMAVQLELVGPGIQANRLKLQTQRALVFAVWQDGIKVPRSEWPETILAHATPTLEDTFHPRNFDTIEDLINFVDGMKGNVTKGVKDEGVVFHPVSPATIPEELASVLDRNGNFKVISNSWLLKHGD